MKNEDDIDNQGWGLLPPFTIINMGQNLESRRVGLGWVWNAS